MEPQKWWLDETAFSGAEHLDEEFVAGYDAKAQFDPSSDLADLQALGLGEGSIVVDLGAGTGTFAEAAAAVGAIVTAVDVSPAMVGAMRHRFPADGAAIPTVNVVQGGFLSYEHSGPSADFVFTRNALHQLPDFWKVMALRRISRLLRGGGILRLRDLCFDLQPDQVPETIDAWMQFASDDPLVGYTAPEFAEHVRAEYSTFTWLLEPMIEQAGFEIMDKSVSLSIYASYTCRSTLQP